LEVDGRVTAPKLVERVRHFERTYLPIDSEGWATLGIAEAIRPEKDRWPGVAELGPTHFYDTKADAALCRGALTTNNKLTVYVALVNCPDCLRRLGKGEAT